MLNTIETKPKNNLSIINPGFMQVNSLEAAMACADIISQSSFCPKAMSGKPGDVVVALQMGQELGLKPMQALQNIAVINGRPSLWGDAMLAVCRQSPHFEYIKEEYLKETNTYICRVKRRDEPEFLQSFSEEDARKAGLWGKLGTWVQYPKRMLQMRARGFALRDAFPDLLRGIITQDEALDMPKIDYSDIVGSTINGTIIEDTNLTKAQIDILQELIVKSASNETDICQHLKIESLNLMPTDKWDGICRLLKKKIMKKQKEEELEVNKVFEKTE